MNKPASTLTDALTIDQFDVFLRLTDGVREGAPLTREMVVRLTLEAFSVAVHPPWMSQDPDAPHLAEVSCEPDGTMLLSVDVRRRLEIPISGVFLPSVDP